MRLSLLLRFLHFGIKVFLCLGNKGGDKFLSLFYSFAYFLIHIIDGPIGLGNDMVSIQNNE